MIRPIYWLAVLLEIILLFIVLSVFILTDARTVKFLAKESLESSNFTYKEIEGNFFRGLELKGISYNKREIFSSATLHWNPLTLLNRKITLQELNVKGIDIQNTLDMVKDFSTSSSSSSVDFDFSILVKNIHLDIKPYSFEGVEFSNLLFESDEVALSKDFKINTSNLYLKFDSDLVDVKLRGDIRDNGAFIDTLSLKDIDSKVITQLVDRLNKKSKKSSIHKSEKVSKPFIEKIELKKITATMRDVTYSPVSISKTKVKIFDVEVDPYRSYSYSAKRVKVKSTTSFGTIDFDGEIKESMIYAKGYINLSKELFKRYNLPLNYLGLKSLKGKLRLNHYGVWLDIDHSLKKLLKIDSAFNLDILNSRHRLYYDYGDNNLTIDSEIEGKMPYADRFKIKNRVIVDNKSGFRYLGEIEIAKLKALPKEISNYLLEDLKAKFKGDSKNFNSILNSKLLEGKFRIIDYKRAVLTLNSRGNNIELDRLTSAIPSKFKNSRVSFNSKTFLDFKDFKKSNTKINLISNIFNIDLNTNLLKPFKINFKIRVPFNSIVYNLYKDIKFSSISELRGELSLSNSYILTIKGKGVELFLEYNPKENIVKRATLSLDGNRFSMGNGTELKVSSLDIEELLKSIKKYYKLEVPKIYGKLYLDIIKDSEESKESFSIHLKSEKIRYESTNIYDIDIRAKVDLNGNIEVERYKFRIDDNGYMSRFFSDKKSYFIFNNSILTIKEFWINNQLLLGGEYNLATFNGDLHLKAKEYNYKNRDFDILVDIGLNISLNSNVVEISGDIDILGNIISYELDTFNIVEDSDIIILQDKKRSSNTLFDNLTINIKVNSKNPIKYMGKDVDIDIFNDLQILKRYKSDILIMGMSTIKKGYYQIEDKYFTLDDSHIYFAGDPKKPQLDIKADYRKDNYVIHIFISGTPDEPIINFTSEPYLTQQEILSLILFDGTGERDGGGAEAYTLLGGTLAKGIMRSLGVDIDHLLLGTDEQDNISFEIGRKISKDITVIYQHKNGKDGVKARIEHSKNFETDITIQPPNSSSLEFLYKYSR